MTLFFAWTNTFENFNAEHHARHDLPIFSLKIAQTEGRAATASIQTKGPLNLHKGAILSKKLANGHYVCLFQGFLSHPPTKGNADELTLHFKAAPENLQEHLTTLLEEHKQTPFYDPLFIPEDADHNPEIIKLSRPVEFYIDRISHKVSLSPLLEGSTHYDVTSDCARDSVHLQRHKNFIDTVNLKLEAQWIQNAHGWVQADRALTHHLPLQKISSYTGSFLKRNWPKTGQKLGRTGYWVAFSDLKEESSQEDHQNARTLWVQERGFKTKMKLTKRWFKTRLFLGWALRQKRKESLKASLTVNFDDKDYISGRETNLYLSLKKPLSKIALHPFWTPYTFYTRDDTIQHHHKSYRCTETHQAGYTFDTHIENWELLDEWSDTLPHENTASFFLTDRGRGAFEHALDIARTTLLRQSRLIKVSLEVPLEKYPHLTTNDTLSLTLNDQSIELHKGKITHYTIQSIPENNVETILIEAAFSIGTLSDAKDKPEAADTYSFDYAEDHYTHIENAFHTSPSQLCYESFSDQFPDDFYAHLQSTDCMRLIQRSVLKNEGEAQDTLLQHYQYPQTALHMDHLNQISTQCTLNLADLHTQDMVEHTIQLNEPITLNLPSQVSFL